jgi:hypothetical protein
MIQIPETKTTKLGLPSPVSIWIGVGSCT